MYRNAFQTCCGWDLNSFHGYWVFIANLKWVYDANGHHFKRWCKHSKFSLEWIRSPWWTLPQLHRGCSMFPVGGQESRSVHHPHGLLQLDLTSVRQVHIRGSLALSLPWLLPFNCWRHLRMNLLVEPSAGTTGQNSAFLTSDPLQASCSALMTFLTFCSSQPSEVNSPCTERRWFTVAAARSPSCLQQKAVRSLQWQPH